jgi:D-serine deaminase-like pyridoxal phosphate-dependent protein
MQLPGTNTFGTDRGSALVYQMSARPGNRRAASSLDKGLGFFDSEDTDIAGLNWNLLREDLSLPSAVLYEHKLRHNLDWMQRFTDAYKVKLAPHGKTTMAPTLFLMQLKSGAWGITLATAQQTRVAYWHGVRRVLMANQLIGKENMAIISRLMEDPTFEYYCLVDSAEQIDLLGNFYSRRNQRLNVLLELGVHEGRTGLRDDEQLTRALDALQHWGDVLLLSGVEIYEGVLDDEVLIRGFLQRALSVTRRLAIENRFQRSPILLSGAGSAWYDVVTNVFTNANLAHAVDIVLRPGCYLSHDAGMYREAQKRIMDRNLMPDHMGKGLIPALQVWAYVQSIPERNQAIVGMGKRDASFDAGLPTPSLRYRPGAGAPTSAPAHWALTRMMDQHAYMQIAREDDLRVGDMIGFDISHPCLTFDKWRALPLLDEQYRVVDVIRTFF